MHVLRTISAFAALPILLLTLFGIGNHEGLFEAYDSWKESKVLYQQALARNQQLIAERDEYARRIEKLRSDSLEKEWLVRSFGYIRPGEKVYRIVYPDQSKQDPGESYTGSVHGDLSP